ncbi:MAG: SPASM domain-containing protein, partial [Anaerolineales bacterium]
DIVALRLFDRVKLLELLPVGRAGNLKDLALTEKADLDRLARLREHYQARGVRVGAPLWRVEGNHRGCRLGYKDFVVGPHGELAGCTLMFYLNQVIGNTHDTSLQAAWQVNIDPYRHKENHPVSETCTECALYARDLCWGGCVARNLIHGEVERLRSCGVVTSQDSLNLLAAFQQAETRNPGGKFFAPYCANSIPEE